MALHVADLVSQVEPEMYDLYTHLHTHPELSMQEFETSKRIKAMLDTLPLDSVLPVGETGWVAAIHGTKPGEKKVLALRGDMDALPIQEPADHCPTSQNPGVMHACGHDIHTAGLMGAVKVLLHYKAEFSGTLLFFFQQGEEVLGGAKLFLQSPNIDFDAIDAVAACHVSPEIDAGTIGVRYGAILASTDTISITVTGKSGHGAHPHTVIDPIVISAQIITALQTLVARETNSADAAVLSICTIHGGQVSNIVPDSVTMTGTLRTLKPEVRSHLLARIPAVCEGIATAMRGNACVTIDGGPPPFLSDDEWVTRVKRSAGKLLGEENVIEMPHASMGAEDFAYIKERKPGVFVRVGTRTPGGAYGSMHSPTFYADRKTVATDITTLVGMALDFFGVDF